MFAALLRAPSDRGSVSRSDVRNLARRNSPSRSDPNGTSRWLFGLRTLLRVTDSRSTTAALRAAAASSDFHFYVTISTLRAWLLKTSQMHR